MTWREWTSGIGMRTALGALVLAAGTLAWTVAAALRTDDVSARPEAPSIAQDALDAPPRLPRVDVAAAVATDLFASDRTAPPVRYRPPDEPAGTSGGSAQQPPPEPVVLGTAIAVDGSSFATCQLGSSRLLMVRVGDHVGRYVVKSIERGRVVFGTPAGKQLVILAPRPGS
jgi:hypothetical protein